MWCENKLQLPPIDLRCQKCQYFDKAVIDVCTLTIWTLKFWKIGMSISAAEERFGTTFCQTARTSLIRSYFFVKLLGSVWFGTTFVTTCTYFKTSLTLDTCTSCLAIRFPSFLLKGLQFTMAELSWKPVYVLLMKHYRTMSLNACLLHSIYSKTCLKWQLKKDQKLVFKTDYRLMQVKSIAECSKRSILQYFEHSLSYHLYLSRLFCLFWVATLDRFYSSSLVRRY